MPCLREEIARQVHILGGDPHLAVMTQPERGRDIVEIGHGADIDPGLRHRDHDIGEAEAEAFEQDHTLVGLRNHLAHQILAGDAHMGCALRKLGGDFGRGKIGDLDAVQTIDGAAIVACATRLDEAQARAREEIFRILLQAALGRHRDDQGRAHAAPPARRSIQIENPTAGMGEREPSRVSRSS